MLVMTFFRRLFCAAALLALSACGGGITVGGGIDFGDVFDATRPEVSIAVPNAPVLPGQLLQIAAAASDESGIESVTLFRQDPGGTTLISGLARAPYTWQVVVPNDGRPSVSYYVQAIDNAGNRANSNLVTITILR